MANPSSSASKPEARPPDHPLIDLLPELSLEEIRHWEEFLKREDPLQQNRQLGARAPKSSQNSPRFRSQTDWLGSRYTRLPQRPDAGDAG